jgi:hypothetical protein
MGILDRFRTPAVGADPFAPHMPDVDVPADLDVIFARFRAEVAGGGPEKERQPGQRVIGVVTPGRTLMFVPAPRPGSIPKEKVAQVAVILPLNKPLNVTAISYTQLEPLMKDKVRCIPMLGGLLGLAYAGHNVLVFEGHPSAFEAALAGADALLIDSGMLPFLQQDWAEVAFRTMGPGSFVRVYERKSGSILQVVKNSSGQGWTLVPPDREVNYVNCLLTTLAKAEGPGVQLVSGRLLPDLSQLTSDPNELEWISKQAFQYEAMNADKVMKILGLAAGLRPDDTAKPVAVLKAQLAGAGGTRQGVAFRVVWRTDAEGRTLLDIVKA